RADRQRRSRHGAQAAAAVRGAQPARHHGSGGDARSALAQESAGFADHAARPRAAERSDRRAALSPAARGGRPVSTLASRRNPRRNPGLVPQARLAGPMPWVIAIMMALTV